MRVPSQKEKVMQSLTKEEITILLFYIMLQKLFGFDPKVTTVKTEIIAGITTFLTMAYILAINPSILATTGMDKGALFTTTVLTAVIPTLLMALYAKLPFALAPGMGLNAFFAYTICLTMGYRWQFALTAVLIEGIIFILLTATNIREKIVDMLPETIKNSLGGGIGLFIAFIGFQNAGIIVKHDATFLTMGDITTGPALLGIIGLTITSLLLVYNVKGALLIGIIVSTLIGIPMGITESQGVISAPPSIEPIFCKFEFSQIFTKDMLICVFTLLFIDMFDTIGTLVGVSMKAKMTDENGRIPFLKKAFFVDSIGTTLGAMLGTSTVTTFVESAAGVGTGGRTGLTAFSTAVCFFLALFLSPLFLSIPGAATGPVLILVGLMMASSLKTINFDDYSESIPAFLCVILMPLAYSISDGIVVGLLSYIILKLLSGQYKQLHIGTIILGFCFLMKYFM